MINLSTHIRKTLDTGNPVVLATVIHHAGSTPRGAGAKMLILKDGTIVGTIGGGAVEAEVIRCAPELFKSGGATVRHFDFSSTDTAGSMGMICGGQMDVLLERLNPEPELRKIFELIASCTRAGKNCLLGRIFGTGNDSPEEVHHFLVTAGGSIYGNTPPDHPQLEALIKAVLENRAPVRAVVGTREFVIDPFIFAGCVYLFGAGHISQKISLLLNMVDFRTVVIDDRKEFANRERFPTADDIRIPANFGAAFSELHLDKRDLVVIVTRGHAHDQTVLEHVLKTEAGYIGMIGSKRKRDTIYDNLADKGISRHEFTRIHCPIGLDIGAKTPEEIALCIVAQLIAHRAGRKT